MNKLFKITLGLSLLGLASCNRYLPEGFTVAKPQSVIQQETIDSFSALKIYINRATQPNFKLGTALSLSDYVNKGVMYRLANSNFDEIALGYEMKHGAVVQANGTLALDNINKLLNTAKGVGMSVYGHTLCWHANQNATYLNGLISPLQVTTPAYANNLDISGLQSATLAGWNPASAGAGISVAKSGGMISGTNVLQLVSGSSSSSATSLQLISPSITIIPGHKFQVLCYIKSNIPGQGRIAFEGLGNNTPKEDWTGTGTATDSFATGISWQAISFPISDFTGNSIKLHLDLGYKPNVTYSIDVNNLYVYDTQGAASITNLVQNGDFESGSGWGGWGGSSTRGITIDGLGYGGKGKAFYVTSPTKSTNFWDVQTSYTLAKALNNGETYTLSFWVKGTATGMIRPAMQSSDYSSNGFGTVNVTTNWQLVELSTSISAVTRNQLVFSYGEFAGTVYIDNVLLKSSKSVGGTFSVEKSVVEKDSIVTGAMQSWISGMVSNSKTYVNAWDVVNEPMDDGNPYNLKTGIGQTNLASDQFYWQDYMGKDYALNAFQLASQYGNPTDLHFINDYNLEYNLDKCKGLIAYVQYIESKGAKVDGIGTQMHIDIKADTLKIQSMLQLLVATGKQIRISELDIGLGGIMTPNATQDQYMAQAKMYKYVIDKYFAIVPAAQRYGITIWSPLDSPTSSSWRSGEPIGLWTSDYVRKLAYAYVAQALAIDAK